MHKLQNLTVKWLQTDFTPSKETGAKKSWNVKRIGTVQHDLGTKLI